MLTKSTSLKHDLWAEILWKFIIDSNEYVRREMKHWKMKKSELINLLFVNSSRCALRNRQIYFLFPKTRQYKSSHIAWALRGGSRESSDYFTSSELISPHSIDHENDQKVFYKTLCGF